MKTIQIKTATFSDSDNELVKGKKAIFNPTKRNRTFTK